MDHCSPTKLVCPNFVSDTSKYGTYENTTWSLQAGGACDITVNAKNGIARVIFAETSYLGIEPIPDQRN